MLNDWEYGVVMNRLQVTIVLTNDRAVSYQGSGHYFSCLTKLYRGKYNARLEVMYIIS